MSVNVSPSEQAARPPRVPSRGRRTIRLFNFARWLSSQVEASGVSRKSIARHFGYKSVSRITEYLSYKRVPGPDVVRRFADAIGLSPIAVLREAGYYTAILEDLRRLYERGWIWCQRDRVSLDHDGGCHFYFPTPGNESDPTVIPPHLVGYYHDGIIFRSVDGEWQYRHAVPLPIAIAVLLVVGYFPRRGDRLREGVEPLLAHLAMESSKILQERWVNSNPNRPPKHFAMLQDAATLFDSGRCQRPARTAVCSEYLHGWIDQISSGYARFARLALYSSGGILEDTDLPGYFSDDPWKYQFAQTPAIDEIRVLSSELI
jgi:hypothetical protein